METLTKENFWNEMTEKYPETMKKFSIWIDQYKKDHDWHLLFNPKRSIKFHDLPLAMQFGLTISFISEASKKLNFDFTVEEINRAFVDHFEEIEESLTL